MPQQKISTSILILILIISVILLSLSCEEEIPEGPELVQVIEADFYAADHGVNENLPRTLFPHPTNYENRYNRPRYIDANDWQYLTDFKLRFKIKVTNTFDETIDGLEWIDIKLRLWSTNYPAINCTLSFSRHRTDSRQLVLHPGESFNVYTEQPMIWEQTDATGRSIHQINSYQPFAIRVDSVYKKLPIDQEQIYFCDTTYFAPVDTVVWFDPAIEMKAQADVKIFKNYDYIASDIFNFKIIYFYPPGMVKKQRCPVVEGKLYGDGG